MYKSDGHANGSCSLPQQNKLTKKNYQIIIYLLLVK